jgi:acetoacetyl-CoA synthetase
MDDFAVYNGKVIDLRQKMAEIVEGMRDVRQFEGMVSMPRFPQAADITHVPRTTTLSSFIGQTSNESPPPFEHVAFHEPLFIAYSSGTTGRPKCIVHSVGGALLSSAKETVLHREIEAESVTLQYTTTGWIMYFASVMHLFAGARNVLYDGSPLFPEREMLLDLMAELKVTMLGTSPRWMHEMSCHGVRPRDVADLSSLKMVTSTGMVLSDQLFEWFYDLGFPKHVHLANISGGTDIVCL